jgi:transcriptional regulator with XRE-family HTH domain
MSYSLHLFGDTVRQLREARGWSQEELADRCQLHRTYIGGVERGERNIGLLNVLKIAQALDIAPSRLLDNYEAGQTQDNPEN